MKTAAPPRSIPAPGLFWVLFPARSWIQETTLVSFCQCRHDDWDNRDNLIQAPLVSTFRIKEMGFDTATAEAATVRRSGPQGQGEVRADSGVSRPRTRCRNEQRSVRGLSVLTAYLS